MCLQASSLDGTNGFTIYGRDANDWTSWHLSSGDVNGDGAADVIVGLPYADGSSNSASNTGEVFVVFGIPPPPVRVPWDGRVFVQCACCTSLLNQTL